jgi:hypothetical protein
MTKKPTKEERVLQALKDNPLIGVTNGWMCRNIATEATRRVRDLREKGHLIEGKPGKGGLWTYFYKGFYKKPVFTPAEKDQELRDHCRLDAETNAAEEGR